MIDQRRCPKCLGPVFAPDDSHEELLRCDRCSANLITRQLAGVLTIEIDRVGEALREAGREHELAPGWQDRVWARIDGGCRP